MTTELLKKISPAALFPKGLPRLDVENAPKEMTLYSVYGMTNDIKTGSTDKGDWLSFKGQFEAIREDGTMTASGNVFLPQPMQDMLHLQLVQAQQQDKNATVEFACRVYIVPPKPGKPSATGYEYRCEPLVEAKESQPMLNLRAAVLQKMRLLDHKSEKKEGQPSKK